MDFTPLTAKRMKIRVIRRGGRLESWFSGEGKQIEKYLHETSRKVINNPKLISFAWMEQEKLMEVRNLLKEQMLKRFMEISGNVWKHISKFGKSILHKSSIRW